ncbi:hypothetical protein PCE1_000941 [Barthelona sp. PCE]
MTEEEPQHLLNSDAGRQEILILISEYLKEQNLIQSARILNDEASLVRSKGSINMYVSQRVVSSLVEGDFHTVEDLLHEVDFRGKKQFLYRMYRQHFLELMHKEEYSTAQIVLMRFLKRLERNEHKKGDFHTLCYLLTCKRVDDVDSLKNWSTVDRTELVDLFNILTQNNVDEMLSDVSPPHGRLTTLLGQALQHQLAQVPHEEAQVDTFFSDHEPTVIPDHLHSVLEMENRVSAVKACAWISPTSLISANSVGDVALFVGDEYGTVFNKEREISLTKRVWDVAANENLAVVGCSQGDIHFFEPRTLEMLSHTRLDNDIYSIVMHPFRDFIFAAGFSAEISMVDSVTGTEVTCFKGHSNSVTDLAIPHYGSLLYSSSKDRSIKVWDVLSGACVHQHNAHLHEVSSIALSSDSMMLASVGKDHTLRLWDLRMQKLFKSIKGIHNTSENFVRCCFGNKDKIVYCGSQSDGLGCYDVNTGLKKDLYDLCQHEANLNTIYDVQISRTKAVLASTSRAGVVALWKSSIPM